MRYPYCHQHDARGAWFRRGNLDGTVNYTLESDFHGEDSFTYTVSDGQSGSSIAIVSSPAVAVV